MDRKLEVTDLSDPNQLATLKRVISEMCDELDVLYSETAPNGNISARQGRLCLYNNSDVYTFWKNTTGSTVWEQISSQADGSAASTGTGTIKMASGSNADSAGFLKFKKADGTIVYVPYFSDETP